jgi:DNA repair protein RadC
MLALGDSGRLRTNCGQSEDNVKTFLSSLSVPAVRTDVAGDAAPALVPKLRRGRAKVASPAPVPAAGADGLEHHERAVIDAARAILRARLRTRGGYATSPGAARELVLLHLAGREHECFAMMFLDAQYGLIAFEELFRGTLTQTSVYPREVVRAAMRHNAAAVILAHNHPSGIPEPSRADELLTQSLKAALALVDVQTLDHLIVSDDAVVSFAERGLL